MNGFVRKSAQMNRMGCPDPFGPVLEPKPSRKRPSLLSAGAGTYGIAVPDGFPGGIVGLHSSHPSSLQFVVTMDCVQTSQLF